MEVAKHLVLGGGKQYVVVAQSKGLSLSGSSLASFGSNVEGESGSEGRVDTTKIRDSKRKW